MAKQTSCAFRAYHRLLVSRALAVVVLAAVSATSLVGFVAAADTNKFPDFSIFARADWSSVNSNCGGRVAVGGNANLRAYSIGDELPHGNSSVNVLIVQGDLTYDTGSVSNGNIVYGGTANITEVGIGQGTAVHQANVVDFDGYTNFMNDVSVDFGVRAPNGATTRDQEQFRLVGTDPKVNIFSFDSSLLDGADHVSISCPEGSFAMINVDGVEFSFGNFETQSNLSPEYIVWNLHQAINVTFDNVQLAGTILAINSSITFNTGTLNGSVFSNFLDGTGTIANFPPVTPVCPEPPACPICPPNAANLPNFSVFSLSSVNGGQGSCQGRIAAATNVTLSAYSIGTSLPLNKTRVDLLAGQNVTFVNGAVSNGLIEYGDVAAIKSVSTAAQPKKVPNAFDFATAGAYLQYWSSTWFNQAPTAPAKRIADDVTLASNATKSGLIVFVIENSLLEDCTSLTVDVPADQLTIVNIKGTQGRSFMQDFGVTIANTTTPSHVIFNFNDAQYLQVDNWNGKGSILAPGALVNFTSGEIDGSIYAQESHIAGSVNLAVPVTPKCPSCPYPPPCTW